MYDTYSDIITDVIVETEERAKPLGFTLSITGGSQQSCSTYFSLWREREAGDEDERQELAVRISDHVPRRTLEPVDYHVGLANDHGATRIDMKKTFHRHVCTFDDDDELLSDEYLLCDEEDEDADLVGFEVVKEEIERVAQNIIDVALTAKWE